MKNILSQMVLNELKRRKVVDINHLSKVIGLPKPEIKRILDYLIDKGIIKEVKCERCDTCPLFSLCIFKGEVSLHKIRLFKLNLSK